MVRRSRIVPDQQGEVDSVIPDDPAPSGWCGLVRQNVGRIVQLRSGPGRIGYGRESWT
jgi:hypothetical protein